MFGWIFLFGFILLVIFHNLWWLVAVFLVMVLKISGLYFYYGRPWRRIHYPYMRVYAGMAGSEAGLAAHEKESLTCMQP